MKIVISSGHGKHVRGARGNPVPPQVDEVDEARRIVDQSAAMMRQLGHDVTVFHDNTSTTVDSNLSTITKAHNSAGPHDLDVSVHLNAYDHKAHGVEVLYHPSNASTKSLAARVSGAIAAAGPFTNRGAKPRDNLYVLNNTDEPCILIETFFCDHTGDCNTYKAKFDQVCEAIAESVTGGELLPGEPEQPPHEPDNPDDPLDTPLSARAVIGKGDKGHDVSDLQALLNATELHPELGVDGDFGSKTEEACRAYQASRGLAADGICGEQTWGALYDDKPPLPPPPHSLTSRDISVICEIALESEIASYSWDDRGVAPHGYTQGMALAFAQTYRKLRQGHGAAVEMAKKRKNSEKDALNVYRDVFDDLGMSNEYDGIDTLRHLYALMLGHGMRESSGRHCEGRDLSASNVQSDTAEAGLFQTSYNAHSASEPLFGNLMREYSNPANKPTCYLTSFDDEVVCASDEWECYGSGEGYNFQQMCKECPAFAAETCGLTLRNLCNHYGPIMRGETELRREADDMLRVVQTYIDDVYSDAVV